MLNFTDIKSDISVYGFTNWAKWKLQNPNANYLDWYKFNCEYFKIQYEAGKMLDVHKAWYKSQTGQDIDYKNLKTFSEKLQYVKLFNKDKRKALLSDKLEAKKWASKIIGEKYIIPVTEIWEDAAQIDTSKIPTSILKFSHGSNMNFLCEDGHIKCPDPNFKNSSVKDVIDLFFYVDYAFASGYEMLYHGIKPKLFAENFFADRKNQKFDGNYKFFCFDGNAEFLQPHILDGSYEGIYTTDLKYKVHPKFESEPEELKFLPKTYKQMCELAKELSKGFDFVRIDFLANDEKIYFCECTFTPSSGILLWFPKKFDNYLSGKIIAN